MIVTYYMKLFSAEADRHNGILMSFFLLVAGTIKYKMLFKLFLIASCISFTFENGFD